MARAVALELLVIGLLYVAYRYGRLLIGHPSAAAFDNATELIGWERALGVPNELAVQHLLLSSESVTRLANLYYATVHFPLTAAFLIWLFVRARDRYREIRTSMALLTGFALVIHAVFPLAPARMLDGLGFVDTAAMYGPTVYQKAPEADSVANQFAAMPSLHFGWAVVVAMGVIRVSSSPWRWLSIAHPVITLLVIVGTGNHYWLDAAVAGGLLLLSEYIVRTWSTAGRLQVRPVHVEARPVLALAPYNDRLVDGVATAAPASRVPVPQLGGRDPPRLGVRGTIGEFVQDPRGKPVRARQ